MVNVAFLKPVLQISIKVMPPLSLSPKLHLKLKKKKKKREKKKEGWVVLVGWPEGSLAIVYHQKMIVLGIPIEY